MGEAYGGVFPSCFGRDGWGEGGREGEKVGEKEVQEIEMN